MRKFLGIYNVIPSLPKNLEMLRELAYNLHWTWNQETRELFRRLDRDLWEETNHNPVIMLSRTSQSRLEEISNDDGFRAQMKRCHNALQTYLTESTWYQKNYKHDKDFNIIYFSAEFGLTECLQTYSGGLGVLAGDHLKAASDLGIPLIGVGLLYKLGYFQQYLTSDGWQQERYELNDLDNLPLTLVKNEENEPLTVSVNLPGRDVFFHVWKIQVGRIPLYLLDTNIILNSEEDRKITENLYGGNAETRIQQEILLGIGGIRMLHALKIKPSVCHMNEGHSAFLSLERIKYLIYNTGLSYEEAKQAGFYSNVFTTHTPVPAGIDVFSIDLVEKYFGSYYRNELKISPEEFYSLGTIHKNRETNLFNMAHLAMNTAGYVNGVSKLHGVVARKMWVSGFPDVPFDEIPIDYVTNGVHIRSHISHEMEQLLIQYIGEKFIHNPSAHNMWERVSKIPDEELWRTHERRREKLVAFVRSRLVEQIKSRGGTQSELDTASEVLNPSALTIGFARRFATYKRATLIFRDLERLDAILNDPEKPVQLLIAGKAHPKDEEGKKLIQDILQIAQDERFRKSIVFIENYDMNVARYMVEGCDVWLNNPRRPLEASGTSGMKVIANAGLNFSVLDGWWDEGFDPELGWKIGNGEEYEDIDYQDELESRQIISTLENDIVPLFYRHDENKLPRKWIAKVKNSMTNLCPFFNTHRMVEEYFKKFYFKSFQKRNEFIKNDWSLAKNITAWRSHVKNEWGNIRIVEYKSDFNHKPVKVGENINIEAEIDLGNLTPADILVQVYYGPVEKQENANVNDVAVMESSGRKNKNGFYKFTGILKTELSGQQGYTIRIMPKHDMLIHPFELGLIYWAE